jgi:hypothetical protein
MSLFNGREREKDEWVELLQRVDGRLALESIGVPKGAAHGIIVAKWHG